MKQRILKTDSPDNYYKESEDTRQKLLSWIASNLIEHGGSYRGSYELKEMFSSSTGIYVSNGTFKTAMKVSGFKPKDDSKPGIWSFKISKHSLGVENFYQTENKK